MTVGVLCSLPLCSRIIDDYFDITLNNDNIIQVTVGVVAYPDGLGDTGIQELTIK